MQSLSLRSLDLPTRSVSGELQHWRAGAGHLHRRPLFSKVFAARRDANDRGYNGRPVDENMIVLRKRIHEMEMIERNYEPPADWTEWEKRYYTSYDSDICEAMRLLQSLLMKTRPSLGLGTLALVILSMPTSAAMIVFHLMHMAKEILSGIHLG